MHPTTASTRPKRKSVRPPPPPALPSSAHDDVLPSTPNKRLCIRDEPGQEQPKVLAASSLTAAMPPTTRSSSSSVERHPHRTTAAGSSADDDYVHVHGPPPPPPPRRIHGALPGGGTERVPSRVPLLRTRGGGPTTPGGGEGGGPSSSASASSSSSSPRPPLPPRPPAHRLPPPSGRPPVAPAAGSGGHVEPPGAGGAAVAAAAGGDDDDGRDDETSPLLGAPQMPQQQQAQPQEQTPAPAPAPAPAQPQAQTPAQTPPAGAPAPAPVPAPAAAPHRDPVRLTPALLNVRCPPPPPPQPTMAAGGLAGGPGDDPRGNLRRRRTDGGGGAQQGAAAPIRKSSRGGKDFVVRVLVPPESTQHDVARCILQATGGGGIGTLYGWEDAPPSPYSSYNYPAPTVAAAAAPTPPPVLAGLFRERDGIFLPLSYVLTNVTELEREVLSITRPVPRYRPPPPPTPIWPYVVGAVVVLLIASSYVWDITSADVEHAVFVVIGWAEWAVMKLVDLPVKLFDVLIEIPLREMYRHGPSIVGWEGAPLPRICAQITYHGDESFWERNYEECKRIYEAKETAAMHVRKPILYVVVSYGIFLAVRSLVRTWALRRQYRPDRNMVDMYQAFNMLVRQFQRSMAMNARK